MTQNCYYHLCWEKSGFTCLGLELWSASVDCLYAHLSFPGLMSQSPFMNVFVWVNKLCQKLCFQFCVLVSFHCYHTQ